MSLPILHPEKVLGTRGPRGIWSGLSIYSLEQFLTKKIYINKLFNNQRGGELTYKVCATILEGFKRSRNIYTLSPSFIKAAKENAVKLGESARTFCANNGNLYGCILLSEKHGFYFNITCMRVMCLYFNDSEDRLDFFCCGQGGDLNSFADILAMGAGRVIDINVTSCDPGGTMETKLSPIAFEGITLATFLCGYIQDPTIIAHEYRESKTQNNVEQEEGDIMPDKYSIKVTYVTSATFKDRMYRILNSKVKGHIRKQRCGPGRLQTKEIFITEHERHYGSEEKSR